jgi:hypothetical protein
LLVGWFVWRRLQPKRFLAAPGSPAARSLPDDTPRGRLLALAHSIRESLTTKFGASWRAKTTEELSADAQLAEVLGRDGLRELIRFLDEVDRLKFAPERSDRGEESLAAELAAWQPSLGALLERIEARPARRRKSKNAPPATPVSRSAVRA